MPDTSNVVPPFFTSRGKIRQALLNQRRQQTLYEVQNKSVEICRTIARTRVFIVSQRIALYYPQQGEVDLRPLMDAIWQQGKRCYFPVLHPFQRARLHFREVTQWTKMRENRYAIPEPHKGSSDIFNPLGLDLVLMPLVAFDIAGNRIGMGGGYYDRTFQAHNQCRVWQRPALMGVAFEFQRVEKIPAEAWDVPLKSTVTEKNHYPIKGRKK